VKLLGLTEKLYPLGEILMLMRFGKFATVTELDLSLTSLAKVVSD
jgi:hypothetical protein